MSRRGVLCPRLQRVDFHGHVELPLPLHRRQHDFRIVVHAQRFRLHRFAVDDEGNVIDAAKDEWTAGGRPTAKEPAASTGTAGHRTARAERALCGLLALSAWRTRRSLWL